MREVAVAVFAKAPIPGYAKTRLIPHLGPEGAANLQAQLIERALATVRSAALGPTTLWCAPDIDHPAFRAAERDGFRLFAQVEGDLGARMFAAFEAERGQPLLLIGTDCPSLGPDDLRTAVSALGNGAEAVIAPCDDGGYGLIATSRPIPSLFEAISWSTNQVMAMTRERAKKAGVKLVVLRTIWDVDTPADYERLLRSNLLTS